MSAVWKETEKLKSFGPLEGNISTDILIVGGGLAGLLLSRRLREAGADTVLCEAKRIGGGITANTTAKITYQHGLIYSRLIKKLGREAAGLYLSSQREAFLKLEGLCEGIDCDYEKKDNYVYLCRDRKRIQNEAEAINSLGGEADVWVPDIPVETVGAVRVRSQGQLNPVKLLSAIAGGLPVFENTKVLELSENKAVTAGGKISFKRVVIATHFPIINKHGAYFLKMSQHRSYVYALKGVKLPEGMFLDGEEGGYSFRTYKDMLLLGGGGHRTGKSGGGFSALSELVRRAYPNAELLAKWATQDCMTLDGVPYIGRYSKNTPNMFVATGFNKWGFTSSMVAADILCDLLCGKENKYERLYSPARSLFHPRLFENALESALGLMTPTAPRCPHMGCALKYNAEENTWDCPCHGSRFTREGELIDNPATDDMKR